MMLDGSPVFFVIQAPIEVTKDSAVSALPRDVSSRFGRRLRELRQAQSLSQLRMAVDFGIDRGCISDLEHGKKTMSLLSLEVIALGMNLSLSELLQDL